MTLSKPKSWHISPLARRLVLTTVAFGTMVALITTAIQLYLDFRRELGQIDTTFQQVTHAHLPTIASALWATNRPELQIALDGLVRLQDMRYVAVREREVLWAEAGTQKSRNIQSREYPLTYQHRDRVETIGSLQVVIDLDGLYQRLLEKFWVILITNSIKTFLVSGFMLWLFYWLVTRHLRKIAEFAARLSVKNLHERLTLARPKLAKPDEFDSVLDGFTRMQSNLATTMDMLEQDIGRRERAEDQLKLSASVFYHSHEGVMITDAEARILDVNPAFTRITGYTREETIGLNPRVLNSGLHDVAWFARMWRSLKLDGHWRGEVWNRRKNGEIFPELQDISAVYDDHGEVRHYVAVFSDISQQKAHEAELARIANYDLLTGLPNRRLLTDRLSQAMARAQRDGKLLAVAYLDLDGFKPINDANGHAVGDLLLVEIGQRLKHVLRGDDTLARLGGDEFVLLLGDLDNPQACIASLERALEAVRAPASLHGKVLNISASIGATLYPADAGDGDNLLRHADQAMYAAKQAGKNRYYLFDPERDREMEGHRAHLRRLGDALSANEFLFYYQPKVNLLTGEMVGVETLIRWQHPERGLLLPEEFLSHFNDHPLEVRLGEHVLETALLQIEAWQREGLNVVTSVNISANHLLHSNFVPQLADILARHPNVAPRQLELEVLESAAMNDLGRAIDVMTRCKLLGVHFALDDFGTGYSSLAYFRRLPVDVLKIDQSFVRDMLQDDEDLAIVESVVRLAQVFGRATIAEGVETLEHAARLIDLGCSIAQGHGIAMPMPANQLLVWLEQWRSQAIWKQTSHWQQVSRHPKVTQGNLF